MGTTFSTKCLAIYSQPKKVNEGQGTGATFISGLGLFLNVAMMSNY